MKKYFTECTCIEEVNAISEYLQGKYQLSFTVPPIFHEETGEEIEISGKNFEELPEFAQDSIKDYSLTIYYFDGITEDEISELFYRLNNGKPLSQIELTRVKATSIQQFQEIATHPMIDIAVSDKAKLKYKDENLAMQIWALCFENDVSFMTPDFGPMIQEAKVTEKQIAEIQFGLNYVLSMYNELDETNKENKRVMRKLKTQFHLVSCAYLAKKAIDNNVSQADFSKIVYNFFNVSETSIDQEYNSSVGSGSGRPESIAKRINALNKLLENTSIVEM